jgi:hypothetical protein
LSKPNLLQKVSGNKVVSSFTLPTERKPLVSVKTKSDAKMSQFNIGLDPWKVLNSEKPPFNIKSNTRYDFLPSVNQVDSQ